jgi:hypothetical protein
LRRRKTEQERIGKCKGDKYILTEINKRIVMYILSIERYN